MAWTENNNRILYKRIENAAAAMQGLREEFLRIKAIAAEFGTDITDDSSGDHTKLELVAFRENVINPYVDFFNNVAVGALDRESELQEWISDTPA